MLKTITIRTLRIVTLSAVIATIMLPVHQPSTGQIPTDFQTVDVDILPGAATRTTDAYSPNPAEVEVGDTVIWTNNDSTLHTATSGTPSGGATGLFGGSTSAPVLIAPGQHQSHTFTDGGEYPYYCILHPNMAGTVAVVDSSADELSVATDKDVYSMGDLVTISGSVLEITENTAVILRVVHLNGSFVWKDGVLPSTSGDYSQQFELAPALYVAGKSYRVEASYGVLEAQSLFRIAGDSDGPVCQGKTATIVGTDKNDVLQGTKGADVIVGLGGDDIINGFGGDDIICGGPGKDRISGGWGDDRIFGGRGSDFLFGNAGFDRLWGGTGFDRMFGGDGDDVMFGGKGRDNMKGGAGEDSLDGEEGDDILDGVDEKDSEPGVKAKITLQLEDEEYEPGDEVQLTGEIVDPIFDVDEVNITITGPDRSSDSEIVQLDDDYFELIFEVEETADDGVYTIEAEYDGDSTFTYFLVDEDNDEVEIETSSQTYRRGDDVEIVGTVYDAQVGVDEIELLVLNPEGGLLIDEDIELDSSNEFEFEFTLNGDALIGRYAIIIEYDAEQSGFGLFEVNSGDDGSGNAISAGLEDTTLSPGDEVLITGSVDENFLEAGEEVVIEVFDPDFDSILDDSAVPENDGFFKFRFELDDDAEVGSYGVLLSYLNSEAELTFEVQPSQSILDLQVTTEDFKYAAGDQVLILGKAENAGANETIHLTVGKVGQPGESFDLELDSDNSFDAAHVLANDASDGLYSAEAWYGIGNHIFSYFIVDSEPDHIRLFSNRDAYRLGAFFEMDGYVDAAILSNSTNEIQIRAWNPLGNQFVGRQYAYADNYGEFEYRNLTLHDPSTTPFGTYAIGAKCGNEEAFLIVEINDDGNPSDKFMHAESTAGRFLPGDEVGVAGRIEAQDASSEQVDIKVQSAQQEVIFQANMPPNNNGTFSFNFALPSDAPEGQYRAFLKYPGYQEKRVLFDVDSRVAELKTHLQLGQQVNVSDDPGHSSYHDLIVLGKHVYIAWMEDEYPKYTVYFKGSHDGGQTFGPTMKLSNDDGGNLGPRLAAFGSDVYVTWLHEGEGGFNARFIASHDHGNTFEPIMQFGEPEDWYARVAIAAYDNNVYLAFEHPASPGTEMLFYASHDRGSTFGNPLLYREGPCVGGFPFVSAWENHVYITAEDPCKDHPPLLFMASHDNGTTFGEPLFLGDYGAELLSKENFVYLLWIDGSYNVNIQVSNDFGNSFNPSVILNGNLDISNSAADLAITEDGDAYVTWEANLFLGPDDIKTHVFFVASHDNAQTFGPVKQLDTNLDYSIDANVAAAGENVFVVWQNVSEVWLPSGSEVMMRRSDDDGASFGKRVVIDGDTGDSLGFAKLNLIAKDDWVYISWWDGETYEAPPDIVFVKGQIVPIE